LGGLTGLENHLETDLEQWKANKVTPLFIFDGQNMVGQDEVSVKRGRAANKKTDEAWEMYFAGQAEEAVAAFGSNGGRCLLVLFVMMDPFFSKPLPDAYDPQTLYPLLKRLLKKQGYHFLVPPYNASAQVRCISCLGNA
jgi:hypothetical protein